jgi:hypothetical protein
MSRDDPASLFPKGTEEAPFVNPSKPRTGRTKVGNCNIEHQREKGKCSLDPMFSLRLLFIVFCPPYPSTLLRSSKEGQSEGSGPSMRQGAFVPIDLI